MKAIGILLFLIPVLSQAAEYYPKSPIRWFGLNQAKSPSCQAEAEVGALEQQFANRGFTVKFSTFYRYAKIWQNASEEDRRKNGIELEYTPEDIRILNAAGSLIPDYMWPEDGEGFNLWHSSKRRPTVSEQALIDLNFPTADSLGFRRDYFTFAQGRLDSRGLDDIKNLVSQGNAVVLSMHGRILDSAVLFNDITGLPSKSYSEVATEVFSTEINHSVAVVGFDDNLQALIIRNSWNDPVRNFNVSNPQLTEKDYEALEKFRLRIFSRNLPGYYALPYAYVNDLVAKGLGGLWVLSIDYGAYLYWYNRYKALYKIVIAPFSCTPEMVNQAVSAYAANLRVINDPLADPRSVKRAGQHLQAIADAEVRRIYPKYRFSFAKLPWSAGMADRVRQFYAGDFLRYYCGPLATQWPKPEFNNLRSQTPDIDTAIDGLSDQRGSNRAWRDWFNLLSIYKEKGMDL